MAAKTNFWYRLGYAWEHARPTAAPERPAQRRQAAGLTGAAATERKGDRERRPGISEDIVAASLAGAAAGLTVLSLRGLTRKGAERTGRARPGSTLLAGVREGLALAVLVPHLPGGRLQRIACCAAAGYAAAPLGGLARIVHPVAPAQVSALVTKIGVRAGRRGLLDHAAFATVFILLHGALARPPEEADQKHAA